MVKRNSESVYWISKEHFLKLATLIMIYSDIGASQNRCLVIFVNEVNRNIIGGYECKLSFLWLERKCKRKKKVLRTKPIEK